MRAAFRVSGFTRLYVGLTASMLGDSIMLLTFSMWVKTLTGSNGLAGLTFFFMVIPSLFAPFMGVWIDRVRRRPLLVWGNLASAVMVLPLLLVRDAGDVWVIWVVAFLYGISFVVCPPPQRAAKEMVPDDPRRCQRQPADDPGQPDVRTSVRLDQGAAVLDALRPSLRGQNRGEDRDESPMLQAKAGLRYLVGC